VTAGCDHCSAWHHFWRACHLLYNDHRQIQALPDGELRSDLEKYIDDQVKTHHYREAKDIYQVAKEDFSQDNCLTLVGNKEKFENADWIIEHCRRLRHDGGMGGVGRGEGGGGLLESGGGPTTMGSGTASKSNSMPAVTFQARTLRGGVVEIGGGPTMVGGNASEIQQGGAVAPAGGGASGGNRPSGEKGAIPPHHRGEPDGAAGSLSSAGDKRKASVDVEEEDDEVYLNFA